MHTISAWTVPGLEGKEKRQNIGNSSCEKIETLVPQREIKLFGTLSQALETDA